jgi:hypothetical protein
MEEWRAHCFDFEFGISFAVPTESVPSEEDEMKAYISEFLLMSQNGQKYIKDIKFSAFPFGDYNITVTVCKYHAQFHF